MMGYYIRVCRNNQTSNLGLKNYSILCYFGQFQCFYFTSLHHCNAAEGYSRKKNLELGGITRDQLLIDHRSKYLLRPFFFFFCCCCCFII